MANDIIKVYSFMRSGTNFLIHSMYQNFYKDSGILASPSEMVKGGNDVLEYYQGFESDKGELDHHNKYMRLFGSHDKYNKQRCCADRSIYIIRNPYDCMHSLYILETSKDSMSWHSNSDKDISYEKWLVDKRVPKSWKEHVTSYAKSGIMLVRYEDLKSNYENEINRIKQAFNLDLVRDKIVRIDKKVGWSAKKDNRPIMSPDHKYRKSVKDIVRKEIPKGFMEYEI